MILINNEITPQAAQISVIRGFGVLGFWGPGHVWFCSAAAQNSDADSGSDDGRDP